MASVSKVVKDPAAMLNKFAAENENAVGMSIPRVTAGDAESLINFANTLFQFQPVLNRFLPYLVNTIAFTKINKMYFTNPLAFAKRGQIPFGYTIQDLWVDVATAHQYNPNANTTEEAVSFIKTEIPNVMSVFHNRNREQFYKRTIYEQELRGAFQSYEGVANLVDRIINSMYTGNDVDEFEYTKNIMRDFLDLGAMPLVNVTPVTNKDTAEDMLISIRSTSTKFNFPKRAYNPMGVLNTSAFGDQILYITPDVDAVTSVKALAYSMHIDEARFTGRHVMIDEIPGHPEVLAILADREFLNIYDNLFESRFFNNPEALYDNYWLHVWQTYFGSPWHNVTAFTTGSVPTVTSVTVTPSSTTYTPGSTITLSATVTGTNDPKQSVIYRVTGNTSNSTVVQGSVIITGIDETGTLSVTATSLTDVVTSAPVLISPAS